MTVSSRRESVDDLSAGVGRIGRRSVPNARTGSDVALEEEQSQRRWKGARAEGKGKPTPVIS